MEGPSREPDVERADAVVVGAGAAGLMAAIWLGRTAPGAKILVLDGAKSLGAKILVAGGGRCNVTHDVVEDRDYAGSTRPAIRKVLRKFGVDDTVRFFAELGVELKREETGKLFPVSDSARSVLDALLLAAKRSGVELRHPRRVERVQRLGQRFRAEGAAGGWGTIESERLILATGGMALPKSGSDGAGFAFARQLGHSVTERVFPGLVPLLLPEGHPLRQLAGITFDAQFTLISQATPRVEVVGSTLCTHFGLSGPAILDISRYWIDARFADPLAHLVMNVMPGWTAESLDQAMVDGGSAAGGAVDCSTPMSLFRSRLPERFARTLCEIAGVEPQVRVRQLPRGSRQRLARVATALRIDPEGHRGFTHAECTAGGVPLAELQLDSMRSRRQDGLWIVGELCDVDGRIGGFNFQWAWATGYLAGRSCGASMMSQPRSAPEEDRHI